MSATNHKKLITADDITLIRSGDKTSFKKLYDLYSGALYGIALRVVISEDIARDVLQDGFVKIWKNFTSYDEKKGTLFTWMSNIIKNTAIDQLRKKAAKYEIHVQDKFVGMADKVNQTKQETDTIDLKDKLRSLSEDHRNVINTVYLMGHTHEDAAKELGLPLGTVKTRVRSAMKELKRIYGTE
ncbi:sigma-70 family RNA polymerase sigma factor [Wandonia haliotis]|uniref:Sigma-70 family RNA polymerase sigma factor n=1 Tax=Wandonia haliotis TaxID=574963 RepID=A0ABN1MM23_9FLAO